MTTETVKTDFDAIKEQMYDVYYKHFPDSCLSLSKPCLGDGIMIVPLLGKNNDEFVNGISHNDPFRTVGSVYKNDAGGYDLKLPLCISGLKPIEDYYAQSSRKVATRKVTGVSIEKLIKTFDRYISALRVEFDVQVKSDNFLRLPFDVTKK